MFNSGNDMSGDESHVVGKSTHDNKSKHNSNSKKHCSRNRIQSSKGEAFTNNLKQAAKRCKIKEGKGTRAIEINQNVVSNHNTTSSNNKENARSSVDEIEDSASDSDTSGAASPSNSNSNSNSVRHSAEKTPRRSKSQVMIDKEYQQFLIMIASDRVGVESVSNGDGVKTYKKQGRLEKGATWDVNCYESKLFETYKHYRDGWLKQKAEVLSTGKNDLIEFNDLALRVGTPTPDVLKEINDIDKARLLYNRATSGPDKVRLTITFDGVVTSTAVGGAMYAYSNYYLPLLLKFIKKADYNPNEDLPSGEDIEKIYEYCRLYFCYLEYAKDKQIKVYFNDMNDSELLDFLREQYSLLHTDDDNVICDGVDRHWIPHHWKAFCAVGPKVPPSSMFMRKNSGSSNNRVLTNVVNSNNNALNKQTPGKKEVADFNDMDNYVDLLNQEKKLQISALKNQELKYLQKSKEELKGNFLKELKNENEIRLAMDKAELTTDEKEKLYKEMVEDAGEEIQQKIKQITQSLEAANNE